MKFRSESAFQDYVIALAKTLGYKIFHQGDARTIQEGKGFVDLVLVSTTRRKLIFAELKMPKGKVSQEQVEWAAALGTLGLPGVYYALWLPRHASRQPGKNEILKALSGPVSQERKEDFFATMQTILGAPSSKRGQPTGVVAQLEKQRAQGIIP